MMRARALAAGASALGILASSSIAARAEASRVVVALERAADPSLRRAEVRLAAELRSAGFAVEERTVDGADDARSLVERPEKDAAPFATVLLRRSGGAAATDVWVADHVTHKTVVRRMSSRGAGEGADRALALRVVELMRASLVEGLVLPEAPEGDDAAHAAPAPAATPALDVASWTREGLHVSDLAPGRAVVVSLGAAGAFGGPDVGLAAAAEARVVWRAAGAWGLGVLAAAPGVGARVTAPEGSATLVQELALAEGIFEPRPAAGPLGFYLALGAGAYRLDATGAATPPYTSGTSGAWAAILGAGGGVRVRVAGATSIVLDLRELVALPRPVVVFAQERVAVAMQPGTLAGLSLAVDL